MPKFHLQINKWRVAFGELRGDATFRVIEEQNDLRKQWTARIRRLEKEAGTIHATKIFP